VTFVIERTLTPLEGEVVDIVKNEIKELILLLLKR
jgi:predicted KAP-like P-loop ATPase